MQPSDEEATLAETLKLALEQASALSLGFVAIHISTAIDHLEIATSARIQQQSDGGSE